MLVQIALGSALILINVAIGAVSALAMEVWMQHGQAWLLREPQRLRLLGVLLGAAVCSLAVITAGVWIWVAAFLALGLFPTLEETVYFAIATYTTLGLGDVLPPQEWRLLAVMAAVNGLLSFGLQTAVMVEALRHARLRQVEHRGKSGR